MRVFIFAVIIAFSVNTVAGQSKSSEINGIGAHKCHYLTSNWGAPGVRNALIDWANGFVSGLSYGANLPDRGYTYNKIEIMALEAMNGCAVEPASMFVEQFTEVLDEWLLHRR
ncbi:hypothetical protein [uncultured Ruegeria sp.]|uniref:hypothetical protein n=1 Tax=uncultured Ruegeria sp. TaxID=259304 RepID=UPI0026263812|nr:hypothetical protein [uncultured Ruegeria sp.]